MADITGPIGGIAIAIGCALIGILVMMRGGGAAVASGVTFVLGAALAAGWRPGLRPRAGH